ncbi:exodeoxyribonuclease VII small subunit [Vandammella animalimorsus]|uniref:Exodeoxyribonuclease 7 small subunit n=1 Tax=Vandammella animalimorsus TaxID=2029117 RepID=A0A2A2ARB6_9BURK|nr:exodeoxyribonuclease VII small subunit [Vandammella animalimorsus]PAT38828.1 exodeoxyribonuclease VII small subunit [Vandammella animalimorsus]PAT41110.1 exodeoxyribonuclease VII small subunit [Vandammella animalimorsus]
MNAAKSKKNEPASYEAAMQELEHLLAQIESGALPLEQLLAGYQRGAQLLAFCSERLQQVQAQVQILDGQLVRPLGEQEA